MISEERLESIFNDEIQDSNYSVDVFLYNSGDLIKYFVKIEDRNGKVWHGGTQYTREWCVNLKIDPEILLEDQMRLLAKDVLSGWIELK